MRGKASVLYWAVAGVLTGFGLIALMTIGVPFLLVGTAMALIGFLWLLESTILDLVGPLRRVEELREFLSGLVRRLDGMWAFPVGFGGLPALVMSANLPAQAPPITWSCSRISFGNEAGGYGYVTPNGQEIVCETFPGQFIVVALDFWGIALLGFALRLATRRLRTSSA